jgi:5-methylcytosine-specific restriction endonuclease McrA
MSILSPSRPVLSLFDGKVCKTCGLWLPFGGFHAHPRYAGGYRPHCRKCRYQNEREQANAYRSRPEVVEKNRARDYERYWSNPEHHRQRRRDWAARNPDKARAQNYTERHLAALRAYAETEEGRKARRETQKRYRQSEHGKVQVCINEHLRRASGKVTPGEWLAILAAYERTCAYCGDAAETLWMDHVLPVARGGLTVRENIVPACPPCNRRKQDNLWTPRPPKGQE